MVTAAAEPIMVSTTQILFNAPALQSLKRDQLVKLCKIHSIKASGKNVELIERLQKHAETLSQDTPLSPITLRERVIDELISPVKQAGTIGMDREAEKPMSYRATSSQATRPSEQWEMVMEPIEETLEESSSQGTLTSLRTMKDLSAGEFGTTKTSNITSSIKSFASSFSLQRANLSNTTLVSAPSFESELYPQQADKISEPQEPLPGHTLRPGVPAPDDARLSLGLNPPPMSTPTRDSSGPTTTIRLISKPADTEYGRTPQLKAFKTTFDLVLGSPQPQGGYRGASVWPNDSEDELLYPSLSSVVPVVSPGAAEQKTLPGALSQFPTISQPLPNPLTVTARVSGESLPVPDIVVPVTENHPRPDPFVFGSPLPQYRVSDAQFKTAAASVLEEMNKRLLADGVTGVDAGLISKLQLGAHADGVPETLLKGCEKAQTSDVFYDEKFGKIHQDEFDKMEGIDEFVKRKTQWKPKKSSSVVGPRKSSVIGHGAGRDKFGRRISGHVGRVSTTRVVSGKKPRVIPGGFDGGAVDDDEDEDGCDPAGNDGAESSAMVEDDKQVDQKTKVNAEAQKEVMRRKLEMNKVKRKSTVANKGRVSIGRGGVLVKPGSQPKTSRFGFLSTAKAFVQSVWGRGKTKPAPTPAKPAASTTGTDETLSRPEKNRVVPAVITSKATVSRPPSAMASKVSASRLDAPITSSTRSKPPSTSVSMLRDSSLKPDRPAIRPPSKATTQAGVSPLATRPAVSESSTANKGVVNLAPKTLRTAGRSPTTTAGSSLSLSSSLKQPSKVSMSSSRLLAPTASSLAKMARPSAPGLGSNRTCTLGLNPITNKSKVPWSPSPRVDKIFSKPLTMFPPSGTPSPVKQSGIPKPAELGAKSSLAGTDQPKNAEASGSLKQRSLNGRKPRISRSRVIAKLAEQRAAGASPLKKVGGGASKASGTPGRKRSSLGIKVQRSSFAASPVKGGADRESVLMSAKKRVRQSEYQARRKSRIQMRDLGKDGNEEGMDVDDA